MTIDPVVTSALIWAFFPTVKEPVETIFPFTSPSTNNSPPKRSSPSMETPLERAAPFRAGGEDSFDRAGESGRNGTGAGGDAGVGAGAAGSVLGLFPNSTDSHTLAGVIARGIFPRSPGVELPGVGGGS